MKIVLNILAKDINKNSYFNSDKCPITLALKRAGYKSLRDTGCIRGTLKEKHVCIDNDNKTYKSLVKKLFSMYNFLGNEYGMKDTGIIPKKVENFEHTLIFKL